MVFHIVLLKLVEWVIYQLLANSCYKAAKKVSSYFFSRPNPSPKSNLFSHSSSSPKSNPSPYPSVTKFVRQGEKIESLVVFDIQGTLLRNDSFFPYFMLVAFEGGSIFRALTLLITYPFTFLFMDADLQLKAMIFVTFYGLRVKDMENVSRAVLPKFFMENLDYQVYKILQDSGESVTVVTSVPRVMVEGFLKEYLGVGNVLATELGQKGGCFTGFVSGDGIGLKHKAVVDLFGDKKPDVGIGSSRCCYSSSHQDSLFLSLCKEGYVVNKEDSKSSASETPRDKYPKPLVFHDGRLAFLPTPAATSAMFLWLPFGILLAVFRLLIGTLLPYRLALFLGAVSGIDIRFHDTRIRKNPEHPDKNGGVLYVCTHRTLLDPVFLSTCLRKPLTAVTYSLSKMSELIAPIKTVRLTRERRTDGETMQRMLREGDLVVCPEGTTCREPYLLRFSSLFAELSDEIVPVAVDTSVGMFYGTTASGMKCLDPIFFLMNPRPRYWIRVLEKLPAEMSCGGGGKSSSEVANYIQRQLAATLGFECTSLTRRDKYLMLAGNEGIVADHWNSKPALVS